LSAGFGVASMLALGNVDVAALASTVGNTPIYGSLAKFTVAFPLVYHYLGAVRHVYWDKNPEVLQNDDVTFTSYGIFGASTILSLALAAFVIE
jgi:succinate dehydrogenase (ubiquinone) cytochrome b560 subunit